MKQVSCCFERNPFLTSGQTQQVAKVKELGKRVSAAESTKTIQLRACKHTECGNRNPRSEISSPSMRGPSSWVTHVAPCELAIISAYVICWVRGLEANPHNQKGVGKSGHRDLLLVFLSSARGGCLNSRQSWQCSLPSTRATQVAYCSPCLCHGLRALVFGVV